MSTAVAERVFKYKDHELHDISPNMSSKQILEYYSTVYPELTNATIQGPEITDSKLEFTFAVQLGEKG